jgi:hypothetical protein
MPGCTVYPSLDSIAFAAGTGGQASHAFGIPNDSLLVGVQFVQQALVVDPAAGNPAGAVVSEAKTGVVGRP